ncbi:hypothetical protein AB0465_20720 [Streptomyces griseoviridis]|uniref:hypothetical protein n=1 Tax=Streptomyces griseoviridis TaxID=45398 RepID=UPI00247CCF85|nr:hypothetical protein [Streptomyces sp. MAA16]
MSATERDKALPGMSGVTMRDLLASCGAARAVSTPPPAPDPELPRAVAPLTPRHRDAA